MLNLPIYYTQEFKTKPSKTFLVGLNWYRNAHHFIKNEVKRHYHHLVSEQIGSFKVKGEYTLSLYIYYKNTNCDGSNIASLMEKMVLDALQEYAVVEQDNVKFHQGTTWSIAGQDKLNPRCEIEVLPFYK